MKKILTKNNMFLKQANGTLGLSLNSASSSSSISSSSSSSSSSFSSSSSSSSSASQVLSSDCTNCVSTCTNHVDSITMTISGFTGAAILNGIYLLPWNGVSCTWFLFDGVYYPSVSCDGNNWKFNIAYPNYPDMWTVDQIVALACTNGLPLGSGNLSATNQISLAVDSGGHFTLTQ